MIRVLRELRHHYDQAGTQRAGGRAPAHDLRLGADVTNNNSLTLQTAYNYDVGDRLTGVSQGSQTRAFVYDGLGRETSATTPKPGTRRFNINTTITACSASERMCAAS